MMINLKVFHLWIKKLPSLLSIFHFFNAATEIHHDRVVSSNKNHPVKSLFPNEMGLNVGFSVRMPLLTAPHIVIAGSFSFTIKVVRLNLGNFMASTHVWCSYGWTDLWCLVRFVHTHLACSHFSLLHS